MWELALKLLEKLQALASERQRIDDRRFTETVKELMTSLEAAHADYMAALHELLRSARDPGSSADQIQQTLEEVRSRKTVSRRQIENMARQFAREPKLQKYHAFFEQVSTHFGFTMGLEGSYMGVITHEVARMKISGDRAGVLATVEQIENEVKHSWTEVTTEYARIIAERL